MTYKDIDILIGQMFIFGFQGYDVDKELKERFQRCPFGGVILFGRNVRGKGQLKRLTTNLQELASGIRPDDKFLIAVDQEGGNLSPLRGVVTSLPGNMALAASGQPSAAYFAGYTTGKDLKELGINLDLTPVLDLAQASNPVIGTRAFSDDPETVLTFGREFIRGISATGVLFTAKHFPGHGSCSEDSHVSLPDCYESRESMMNRDLIPFKPIIEMENSSLMMAHVRYRNLDPKAPASLSSYIINKFLREELGFKGVVMTDCLEMRAAQEAAPYPEDAVKAIEAGNDIILISHTPGHQEASFKAVKQAVLTGRIKISRIEESVDRIRKWRNLRGEEKKSLVTPGDWSVDTLAEKVITYISNGNSWRFNREPILVFTPKMGRTTEAEDIEDIGWIEEELKKEGISYYRITLPENPGEDEIKTILKQLYTGSPQKAVFFMSNTANSPGQKKLLALLAERKEILLICTRNPREFLAAGGNFPALVTYSCERPVMKALVRVLAGEVKPVGRLPVSLQ